ncbi:MAG: hypothetical protein LR015_01695 [Verrucomicrobia bacterium]|nr:hypothetical protein [Verrucomicrobiota bacterium]
MLKTMDARIYTVMHITGAFMIFLAYGGLIVRSMLRSEDILVRKMGAITSGVGLLLVLVSGFGMLSRLHGNTFHPWVIAKLIIWLVLGGLIVLINRKPEMGRALWWVTLLLGFLAIYLGVIKPG